MIPGFRELLHPLETPPFFGNCLQAQTRVAETASDINFLYKKVHASKKGRHATLTYVGLIQSIFFFYSSWKRIYNADLWISVGSTLATEGLNNVDKSSVVLDPPLGASGLLLFLLFSFNFWGLTFDLTSTSQGSVNLKWKGIYSEFTIKIEGDLFLQKVYFFCPKIFFRRRWKVAIFTFPPNKGTVTSMWNSPMLETGIS